MDIISYRIQMAFMVGGLTLLSYFAHFSWGTVGLWAPILLTCASLVLAGLEIYFFFVIRASDRRIAELQQELDDLENYKIPSEESQ